MNERGRALKHVSEFPFVSHWINGVGVPPEPEGACSDVYDSVRARPIRRVAFAQAPLVRCAVEAAERAFPAWAATPAPRRAQILFRYRELLVERREELARIITEENGKTLPEARAELDRGIQVVEFAAGIPHLLKGEYLADIAAGLDSYSLREPLGVCAGVTPFNFPAMVPMWMFPLAIAAGNSFILKPSEKDPSCPLRLAALFSEAGLPPGVFNVLHGARETVEALIAAPQVSAVSFVGSTAAARAVYRLATQAGKRAQCLGGAKNHLLVMPDADMAAAARALVGAAYGCAGERCMAISVAVAVGTAGDALVRELASQTQRMVVGPGEEPATAVGPLISAEQRERVLHYLDLGVNEGAHLVVDGRNHPGGLPKVGYFVGPSVFDEVTPRMQIYRDEIFGPVLCVMRAADLEEAIAITNGHDYANGAAIFTRSGRAAKRFVEVVSAGMVGVNVPIPAPTAFFGFGGHKSSLFGPLHVHGSDGVRFYTKLKTVTSRWPDEAGDGLAPSGF